MNNIVFARVVAIATLYLDMNEELYVDPDAAIQGQEDLISTLQELEPIEVVALHEALQQVALEYEGDAREAVRTITKDFGLVEDTGEADEQDNEAAV